MMMLKIVITMETKVDKASPPKYWFRYYEQMPSFIATTPIDLQ